MAHRNRRIREVPGRPVPVELIGFDQNSTTRRIAVAVDPNTGALLVTGAGAAPAATALKLEDGTVDGRFALVDASGRVHVSLGEDAVGLATDAVLQAVRDAVQAIDTDTDGIAGLLTEATFAAEDFATETTLDSVDANLVLIEAAVDDLETKLDAIDADLPDPTLTSRMFARQPQTGKRIWLDTADSSFIYVAEADAGAGSDQTQEVWAGIRIPIDADGNPLGEVEESTAFRWDNKTSTTGWS